jgi:hypothetical protein
VHYDEQGVMRYPDHGERAPAGVFADYLDHARRLFAAHPDCSTECEEQDPRVSADFEHLRWFELPRRCLAPRS